jgi:large subunit ribosomal protein L10
MNRAQKTELVQEFAERLSAAPFVAVADYRGITVEQVDKLRRALEKEGVEYRVIKNTLAKRAIAGTPMESLGEHLAGMSGWVLSGEDPVAAAKALRDVSKDLAKAQTFIVKGGYFDGQTLDPAGVAKVADLPSKEELLSLLLRTLQAAPRDVMGVIRGPARDLMYLLKNYEDKLASAEGAE